MYTAKDSWRGTFDEELYVSGHTVVWSRGGQDGSRSIMKTFTMDTPVLQALWCSFVVSDDRFKTEETGTSLDSQDKGRVQFLYNSTHYNTDLDITRSCLNGVSRASQ